MSWNGLWISTSNWRRTLMKIALIGNGAMGQLVAAQAKAAGDEVACSRDVEGQGFKYQMN